MEFAPIIAVLCAASMLAAVPAAPTFAQNAHQHTEATPHATASPATPASPTMPSGMTLMPEMMQMIQKMHSGAMPRMAMMGGFLMMPGGAIQNVEGNIAFLKAELKITDAQQKPWDQFADALRTNAKALSGEPGGMMGGADKKIPLAARFEQQEKLLTSHLEALKRSRSALEALIAVLSDEQKRELDELI
jgi:hypothetical protein